MNDAPNAPASVPVPEKRADAAVVPAAQTSVPAATRMPPAFATFTVVVPLSV